MERHLSVRLLAGDDEASVAAPAAGLSGVAHVVREGTHPAARHARTSARRLRHTRRKGIETVGRKRAVQLLGRHGRPVRWGQVTAADGARVFLLPLTEDGGALVACTGVRQAGELPPL